MKYDIDYKVIGCTNYCIYCGEEADSEFCVELGFGRNIPVCNCRGAEIKHEIERLEIEQKKLIRQSEKKLKIANVLDLAERVAEERKILGLD